MTSHPSFRRLATLFCALCVPMAIAAVGLASAAVSTAGEPGQVDVTDPDVIGEPTSGSGGTGGEIEDTGPTPPNGGDVPESGGTGPGAGGVRSSGDLATGERSSADHVTLARTGQSVLPLASLGGVLLLSGLCLLGVRHRG